MFIKNCCLVAMSNMIIIYAVSGLNKHMLVKF